MEMRGNLGGTGSGARLARAANLLLVVALGYSAAQLTWRLWPLPQAGGATAAAALPSPVVMPLRDAGLAPVAALHLFGTPSAAPADPSLREAPETHLNLRLSGVIATGDPRTAAAMIASGGGADHRYHVGAKLPGGAVLRRVLPDRVLLERGGRLETLRLPRVLPSSARGAAATSAAVPQGGDTDLAALRARIVANPSFALSLVHLQPVLEAGRLYGYQVGPGRDPQLLARLGLRPGDVVTEVNGILLSDPKQLDRLFGQLRSRRDFTLLIRRRGMPRQVSVRLGS